MQATETYRVLIIDDNEAIHRDFRSLLQSRMQSGDLADLALEIFGDEVGSGSRPDLPLYAFDSAYQGMDALETVKQASRTGQSYAFAFVDVRMPPGWDGVETIQRIWEVDPNIQMIICSAYADYSWDEIVKELGVTDRLLLLRKPFDPNSVKQMALSVAHRWSRERRQRERIVELEGRVGKHGQELERLGAELEAMRASHQLDVQARAEMAVRMQNELLDILAALEIVAAAPLVQTQMAAIEAALRWSRTLLDELAHDLKALRS
ncbi:MAG TPA: response regulator [Haliangium sp.]|nr:response regulator [Haliangium sp.]